MRLFIAFPMPEDARRELRRQQEVLIPRRDRIRWTPVEQMHLTLKFIGEVQDWWVDEIAGCLEELCASHHLFRMRLGEPGWFGAPENPRVLWTGLQGEVRRLVAFSDLLERELDRAGLPRSDKRFKPHLTLGRVKQARPELVRDLLAASPLPLECPLRELHLLSSVLKSEGAVHHVLSRHILCESEMDNDQVKE